LGLLINKKQNWGFVHIPKTGGTTITNILQKQDGCEKITGHDSLRLIDTDNLFLFTFVRNPFTRLQSAFLHGLRQNSHHPDFSVFLQNANMNDLWLLPQYYYINTGKTATKKISYIGKYENYENDLRFILDKLNIEIDEIPHLNRNPIYEKHPTLQQDKYYKHLYREEWQKDWVRERYKDDFKLFNYGMDI